MSGSYFALNQKYNNLKTQANNGASGGGGGGGSQDLTSVLSNGNSAGAFDLDMNTNDILQVNNINLTTINGTAYPPVVSADTLSDVLIAGNNAGASNINMNNQDILDINNLVFHNSSSLPTGLNYKTFSTSSNTTLTSDAFNSLISFDAGASGITATLPSVLGVDAIFIGCPIYIQNVGAFDIIVAGVGSFTGRYSSSTSGINLQVGMTLGFFVNTGGVWNVFYKADSSVIPITTTTNFTGNYNIFNSTIIITPVLSGRVITLPPINATNKRLYNGFIIIDNRSTVYTVSVEDATSTSLFTYLYGSGAYTLTIQPNTSVKLFINPSGAYNVVNRTPQMNYIEYGYSGIASSLPLETADSVYNLTGVIGTVLTLPDPRTSVNPNIIGKYYTFVNLGTAQNTLASPVGSSIVGRFATSGTAIIPANASLTVTSDGTVWNTSFRAPTFPTYNFSITGATNLSTRFDLFNSNLNISSTVTATVTIPAPTTSPEVFNTSIKITNTGDFDLTISITTGIFSGAYGSGLTTYLIGIGNYITISSDGTNWLVNERTYGINYVQITIASALTLSNQYRNAYLPILNNTAGALDVAIGSATANRGVFFELENVSLLSHRILNIISSSGNFIGAFGSNTTTYILPINSRARIISNGSNWTVRDISLYGFTSPTILSGASININQTQYFRNYLAFNVAGSGTTFVMQSVPNALLDGTTSYLRTTMNITPAVQNNISGRVTGTTFTGAVGVTPVYPSGTVANTSFPYTNAIFTVGSYPIRITALRASLIIGGGTGGTCTGTVGSRTLTVAGLTATVGGNLAIGSLINIGGVVYTIIGVGSATGGTCTGTAGTNSLTLTTVTGREARINAGVTIFIGADEYLIYGFTSGIGTSGTVAQVAPNLLTSPAGTAFTAPTGSGFTGTYTVNPPLTTSPSATAFTITGEAVSWYATV